MKVTDYSKIAHIYDKNTLRHRIAKDSIIEKMYKADEFEFTVLDLSCGTGIYLDKQIAEYPLPEYKIKWIGLDKSESMINQAKQKQINSDLIIADVINMPLSNNSVNYISNRFAFHHYEDKEKAVREIYRILKPNGAINLVNMNPEYMKHFWVYKYFPSAIELDKERFCETKYLYDLLENNRFKVEVNIKVKMKKFKYPHILEDAKNRDMSQLQIITEEEYNAGISKMEEDSKHNEYIIGDFALMEIYGEKIE